MTIGQLIKLERLRRGWSLTELEKVSGVSRTLISQLEKGTKTYFTKLKHKERIARAFGMTVEEFDKLLEAELWILFILLHSQH